jgi:hypothetical protein
VNCASFLNTNPHIRNETACMSIVNREDYGVELINSPQYLIASLADQGCRPRLRQQLVGAMFVVSAWKGGPLGCIRPAAIDFTR